MWGTIAAGIFASTAINAAGPNGLLYGNPHQLLLQIFGVAVIGIFAFVGSYVLPRAINVFSPMRVGPTEEDRGLDLSEFGEEAYTPEIPPMNSVSAPSAPVAAAPSR